MSRTRGDWWWIEPSPALYENTIEFITIPSTGDAVDFGNLTAKSILSATNDSTRGLRVDRGDHLTTHQILSIALR